jgi:DNA-binding response OmpR family regulator
MTGETAFEGFSGAAVDVVLLDVMLPGWTTWKCVGGGGAEARCPS